MYAARYECGDCRRVSQPVGILAVRHLGAGMWSQVRTLPPALFSPGAGLFLGAARDVCALLRRRVCVPVVYHVFVHSVRVRWRAVTVDKL